MEVNTKLLGNNAVPTNWAQLKSVAARINVPGGKPICLSADWARLMAFVYEAGGTGQWKNANSAAFRVPQTSTSGCSSPGARRNAGQARLELVR